MSVTLTVRIPRELKERMSRLGVNWSEEIRRFLEKRVAQLEALQALEDIERRALGRRVKVDSTRLIREDRWGH
ncbi:MAG: CopG family transcriptional regulator [Desulfurococcales archaeon]|nr:CopG family transcriptional regulator [Desulfurococcales archaeon]